MFIKLETKNETEKAYQLLNNSWIPKSVLDDRGLKHPYYQIKDWWLKIHIDNAMSTLEELAYENKTLKDKENSIKILEGIKPLVVYMIDIPIEIREIWKNYWGGYGDSIPDYEPRLWGNDCFEGEMSSWF